MDTTWIARNPTGTGFRFAIGVKPEIAESKQAPLTVHVHLILPASSVHHPRLTVACKTIVVSEKPRPARLPCLAARIPNVAPPLVRIERLARSTNPMRAGNQRSKTLSVPGFSQRQKAGRTGRVFQEATVVLKASTSRLSAERRRSRRRRDVERCTSTAPGRGTATRPSMPQVATRGKLPAYGAEGGFGSSETNRQALGCGWAEDVRMGWTTGRWENGGGDSASQGRRHAGTAHGRRTSRRPRGLGCDHKMRHCVVVCASAQANLGVERARTL